MELPKIINFLFRCMKFGLLCLFLTLVSINVRSQNFNISKSNKNTEKILSIYEKRHFTGVRLVKLKRHDFLVCVIELPNGVSRDGDRVAKVKAQRDISEFLNGSTVTSTSTLVLEENAKSNSNTTESSVSTSGNSDYYSKMIDIINANSSGFINGIESTIKAYLGSILASIVARPLGKQYFIATPTLFRGEKMTLPTQAVV